jgi:hypothetical protein
MAVVHGDGRVDQIAAERPEAGKRAVFVGPGHPAKSDDVSGEDRREFPLFGHWSLSRRAA